jgi:hypothetical protein
VATNLAGFEVLSEAVSRIERHPEAALPRELSAELCRILRAAMAGESLSRALRREAIARRDRLLRELARDLDESSTEQQAARLAELLSSFRQSRSFADIRAGRREPRDDAERRLSQVADTAPRSPRQLRRMLDP